MGTVSETAENVSKPQSANGEGYYVVTIGVDRDIAGMIERVPAAEVIIRGDFQAAKNFALLCKGRKVSEIITIPGIEADTEIQYDDEYLGMHKIKGATVEFYDGEITDVDGGVDL